MQIKLIPEAHRALLDAARIQGKNKEDMLDHLIREMLVVLSQFGTTLLQGTLVLVSESGEINLLRVGPDRRKKPRVASSVASSAASNPSTVDALSRLGRTLGISGVDVVNQLVQLGASLIAHQHTGSRIFACLASTTTLEELHLAK